MGHKVASFSYLLLNVLLVVSTTTISALNITRTLEKFPNYSTMNELFTKTGVVPLINQRNTITVLAVENGAIGGITGKPEEELRNILMNHVVLDYFDELKLKGLKDQSSLFTTLYQTTGLAEDQNGFLNCTKMKGKILFGSAVKGSPLEAQYIGPVFQNPYNLSIIQISMPIVAPGLGAAIPPSPLTSPPAPAPKKGNEAPAPGPSEDDDPSPRAAPKAAPNTAPAKAPTSADDSPAAAPSDDGKKETPPADKTEPPSASSSSPGLSFGAALLLGLVASFIGFW